MSRLNPHRALRLLIALACCVSLLADAAAEATAPSDRWQWPTGAPVPVASSFSPPARDWLPGRRGVTLAYAGGSPVYACDGGTVTFAGRVAGRGVVTIMHEVRGRTVWSTYLPLEPSVSVGDRVSKGALIGVVEEGSDTLHWGAKTGPRSYIDPIRLTLGRPRLLPWDGDAR